MNFLLKVVLGIGLVAICAASPVTVCKGNSLEEAKKSESALTNFAISFYKNASASLSDKNAVMSPVSIALALALLESGADGPTRDQLKNILAGVGSDIDVLKSYASLNNQLKMDSEKTKLKIANGIFVGTNAQLKRDYISGMETCFQSDIENVDFEKKSEETRQKINQFISNNTESKIPELFKPGVLSSDVVLVLANAIYFKSSWQFAFESSRTKSGKFYKFGREAESQSVPFMAESAPFGYASTDEMELVELPYKDNDLSMIVFLPKSKNGLANLEENLTGDKFKQLVSKIQMDRFNLVMPKFTIRTPIDLKELLSNLGADQMFGDSANFSRMSQRPLKVSKAKHEAYINVNENGTEAAAATGFALTPRSGPPTLTVTVDHPFLYAIIHKKTGAIIFIGKVNFIDEQAN